MKKTLLVALLACLTIMFASCKKEKTLNGTTWKTHTTTTQQVGEGALSLTANITFDGTMSEIVVLVIPCVVNSSKAVLYRAL